MDWKAIAGKVLSGAPILGSILGGPAGGALGTAINVIGQAFGLKPEEVTPAKVNEILKADPEALLKLRQAEMANELELTRAYMMDVQNARSREIELTKVTGKRDINLYFLAWCIVMGFFGLCGILMWKALPIGSDKVVFMLFGALSAGFGQVLQYFFGSSRGSAIKTALMEGKK